MKRAIPVTTLFLDIGGVLLTEGWVPGPRKPAAKALDLNPEEIENRHNQAFDTYQLGKLTSEEYLSRVVVRGAAVYSGSVSALHVRRTRIKAL